jgi:hypothetical protein
LTPSTIPFTESNRKVLTRGIGSTDNTILSHPKQTPSDRTFKKALLPDFNWIGQSGLGEPVLDPSVAYVSGSAVISRDMGRPDHTF